MFDIIFSGVDTKFSFLILGGGVVHPRASHSWILPRSAGQVINVIICFLLVNILSPNFHAILPGQSQSKWVALECWSYSNSLFQKCHSLPCRQNDPICHSGSWSMPLQYALFHFDLFWLLLSRKHSVQISSWLLLASYKICFPGAGLVCPISWPRLGLRHPCYLYLSICTRDQRKDPHRALLNL